MIIKQRALIKMRGNSFYGVFMLLPRKQPRGFYRLPFILQITKAIIAQLFLREQRIIEWI